MQNARRRIPLLLLIVVIGTGLGAAFIRQRFAYGRKDFRPVHPVAALVPVRTLSPFQQAIVQDLERQKQVVLRYHFRWKG